MKHQLTLLIVFSILLSCSDKETPSNCKLTEAFESQDYENEGEKFKYEFAFNNELLFQTDKFVNIDGVYHLFHSVLYQYNDQNRVIRVDRRDPEEKLLNFTELKYYNDLLIGYVVQSATSLSREERTILYGTDNAIDRVNYSFFKDGEATPFDAYYIALSYMEEKVIISYFDAEDRFTGSIEVSVSSLPVDNSSLTALFDRYYNTPLYLLTNVPTKVVYKDKDGKLSQTIKYEYTTEGQLIQNFTLNQGIRNDLFEFSYSCN